MPTKTFQQGIDSYASCVDADLIRGSPDTNYADLVKSGKHTIRLDQVDESVEGDNLGHWALLKFGDIFGDGAGQIPLGSVIREAKLTYKIHATDTSPNAGPTIHQCYKKWIENTVTWNNFCAGTLPVSTSFRAASDIGDLPSSTITEASGIACSRQNDDIVWTHDDSDGGWQAIAINITGTSVRRAVISLLKPDDKSGTLNPRSSSSSGVLNLGSGHGFSAGNKIDVHWSGASTGSRVHMEISATDTTTVTFSGGRGDSLPTQDTVCYASFASRDIEDIAIGPGPTPGVDYIFIGDIGDNATIYSTYFIRRFVEPTVSASQSPAIQTQLSETDYDEIEYQYPTGGDAPESRDTECLMVDTNGDICIIMKRNSEPGDDGNEVYRLPYPQSTSSVNTAIKVHQFPVSAAYNWISGGGISKDGRWVVFVTETTSGTTDYASVYYRPIGSKLWAAFNHLFQQGAIAAQGQREAADWHPDELSYQTIAEINPSSPENNYLFAGPEFKDAEEGTLSYAVGTHTVNVTTSVAAWSAGVENYGWLIRPLDVDYIDIYSSEATTAADRPLLEISYYPPGTGVTQLSPMGCPMRPYEISADVIRYGAATPNLAISITADATVMKIGQTAPALAASITPTATTIIAAAAAPNMALSVVAGAVIPAPQVTTLWPMGCPGRQYTIVPFGAEQHAGAAAPNMAVSLTANGVITRDAAATPALAVSIAANGVRITKTKFKPYIYIYLDDAIATVIIASSAAPSMAISASAAGVRTTYADSAVGIVTSITAQAVVTRWAAAAPVLAASIAVDGIVGHFGATTPEITTSIIGNAVATRFAEAAPNLDLSIGGDAIVTKIAAAVPALAVAISADPIVHKAGAANPAIAISIDSAAVRSTYAGANPEIAVSIAADCVVKKIGATTLNVSFGVIATIRGDLDAAGALNLAATLVTASATTILVGRASFEIELTKTASAVGDKAGQTAVELVLGLTSSAVVTKVGQATPSIAVTVAALAGRTTWAAFAPNLSVTVENASAGIIHPTTSSVGVVISISPTATIRKFASATRSISIAVTPAAIRTTFVASAIPVAMTTSPTGTYIAKAVASPNVALAITPTAVVSHFTAASPGIVFGISPTAISGVGGYAAVGAVFSLTTSAIRTTYGAVAPQLVFGLDTASPGLIAKGIASPAITLSFDAQGTVYKSGAIACELSFAITPRATTGIEGIAEVGALFSLAANAVRSTYATCEPGISIAISAGAVRTNFAHTSQGLSVSITATGIVYKAGGATLGIEIDTTPDSTRTTYSAFAPTMEITIDTFAESSGFVETSVGAVFALSAAATTIVAGQSFLTITTAISSDPIAFRFGNVSLTSVFTVDPAAIRRVIAASDTALSFDIDAAATTIAEGVIAPDIVFSLSADATRTTWSGFEPAIVISIDDASTTATLTAAAPLDLALSMAANGSKFDPITPEWQAAFEVYNQMDADRVLCVPQLQPTRVEVKPWR